MEDLSDEEFKSPSSQRAWIEITSFPALQPFDTVALLAEGVDRNFEKNGEGWRDAWSPSSQRAWIEICLTRS